MVRVTTWPAWRIRCSSRRNSRGCTSMRLPARVTVRDSRSSSRSATLSLVDGRVDRGAAAERLDPRQQLGEGEGLGEVVVAAGLQALHPLIHRRQRREEQHRRAVALAAQGLDQAHPVHAAGQHAVEHHQVELLGGGEEQAVAAVGRVLHRVAGFLQPLLDEAGDLGVVLDQQDPHRPRPLFGSALARRRGAAPDLHGQLALAPSRSTVSRSVCPGGSAATLRTSAREVSIRLAVQRDHQVALAQPGAAGGAVALHARHQHAAPADGGTGAARFLRHHVLHRDAEPAALHPAARAGAARSPAAPGRRAWRSRCRHWRRRASRWRC